MFWQDTFWESSFWADGFWEGMGQTEPAITPGYRIIFSQNLPDEAIINRNAKDVDCINQDAEPVSNMLDKSIESETQKTIVITQANNRSVH